jgi:hypothetical protein
MFFNRPDYDLVSAVTGSFALVPTAAMIDALARDYANMTPMIFGEAPQFEQILASMDEIERAVNRAR